MSLPSLLAPLSLVVAAAAWGIVWYPYRLLEQAGMPGVPATLLTYAIALVCLLVYFRPGVLRPAGNPRTLGVVALVAGVTNLAYVLAVIDGEIMRVMLLFYLAPLWTLMLARLLLNERPNHLGYVVVALSLTGAYVMLAPAGGGLPLPGNFAEWLGLIAGVGFALGNVLSRRLRHVAESTRSAWIFAGVLAVTLIPALGGTGLPADWPDLTHQHGLLALVTAGLLILATVSAQYGLAHVRADRAVVILLSELFVAALASAWLAEERMGEREWIGGAMIVAASLFSGKMEKVDA
jgi:drug/metabolite transporter (DMT)-like permease